VQYPQIDMPLTMVSPPVWSPATDESEAARS